MKYKKAKIKVPEHINEITLAQYQLFIDKVKDLDPEQDDLLIKQYMIHCFCGVDFTDALTISYIDVEQIAAHINSFNFENPPLERRFKINEVEFGFIPNMEKVSMGEYADMDKYIEEWDNAHRLMAVMFRPINNKEGEKYSIQTYEGTEEWHNVMRYTPLGVALGARLFFYHLGKELLAAFPSYLQKETQKGIFLKQHSSEESGDGIHRSINLLRETLEGSMK